MEANDRSGAGNQAADKRQAIAAACRDRCAEISGARYEFPDAMHRSDWVALAALTVASLIVLVAGVYL